MIMTDTCKLTKLVDRLQHFSSRLEIIKDLNVHQHINHFYYMQKKAELLALSEQIEEAKKRLSGLIAFMDKEYTTVFFQWSHDIRWLNTYQMIHQN